MRTVPAGKMKVLVFLAVITVQVIQAEDALDWDGLGAVDDSLYRLTPLSIVNFKTEQSSTYTNLYPSSKAVDGNVDHGFACTKNDYRPYWRVFLQEKHCIGKVTLYNRKDCCSARLTNAVVRAGIGRCGVPVSYYQTKKLGGVINVYCDPPLLANEISVVLPTKQYLQLQEVMVEEYPIQRCNQLERRLEIVGDVTNQISEYDATRFPSQVAADGFISNVVDQGFSCTALEPNPWWKVNLGEVKHCISKVILYNRIDCCGERLSNAVVRAGENADTHSNAQCGSPISLAQAKIPGGVLVVHCGAPLKAKYVSVDLPVSENKHYLQLREVEVYELDVDVNHCESDERVLSIISKPTEQSSYYDKRYKSSTAADGNLDTKLSPHFICAVTQKEVDPWWLVDLEAEHCISRILVLNRGDCCSKRLTNALVRAGTNTDIHANPQCGDVVTKNMAAPLGGTIEFICDPPLVARYVSVDIPSDKPSYLQLCEVTVMELITEDACREPEPVVIEEPEPVVIEEPEPAIVEKAPKPQKPVENLIPKEVGGGPKIRNPVPHGMGP